MLIKYTFEKKSPNCDVHKIPKKLFAKKYTCDYNFWGLSVLSTHQMILPPLLKKKSIKTNLQVHSPPCKNH